MDVVILCGGLGSRLGEETILKPKPMVKIGDKPILWHIMKTYAHYGYNEFVIALGYKANVIKDYLNDSSKRIQGAAGIYFYRMTRERKYLATINNNLSDQNAFLRQSAAFDLAQCHDAILSENITAANLPNNVKMAALKQILETHARCIHSGNSKNSILDSVVKELISKIDSLVTDAIQGNLPSSNLFLNRYENCIDYYRPHLIIS